MEISMRSQAGIQSRRQTSANCQPRAAGNFQFNCDQPAEAGIRLIGLKNLNEQNSGALVGRHSEGTRAA
jgi:hypothetical protein